MLENNIESVTEEQNVTNEPINNDVEKESSTPVKPKGNKLLTFGIVGAAVLALGAGYFFMTNNSQPAKTVAPTRTHAASSSNIKSKLKQLGVHLDSNHLKGVNSTDDKIQIYVNASKITLNKRQFVDFEILPKTGEIFVPQKDVKIAFVYELTKDNEVLATKKIQYKPASNGIKDVAVKDMPSEAKVEAAKPSNSSKDAAADFCDKAQISDNSDEMRETFKSIAHNLNLGPLEMLLGPAMPRIVQNSQKIKVGSEYVNYVTTEDGNGTLGEYLPDILQKDQMNLGTLSLNMKKAMQDSNYAKIIVNKNTTAIYPDSLDAAKAKKLIGCF